MGRTRGMTREWCEVLDALDDWGMTVIQALDNMDTTKQPEPVLKRVALLPGLFKRVRGRIVQLATA